MHVQLQNKQHFGDILLIFGDVLHFGDALHIFGDAWHFSDVLKSGDVLHIARLSRVIDSGSEKGLSQQKQYQKAFFFADIWTGAVYIQI